MSDDAQGLQDDVQNIVKATAKLQRMLAKIGTRGDDSAFRATLQRERDEAQRLCRKVMSKLKRTPDKNVLSKLGSNFASSLTAFDKVCEEIEAKQKNAVSLSVSSRQTSPLSMQQSPQSQAQSEEYQFMPYAVDELEQRKKDIQQLERDVLEVREIFADLNRLVNEQQANIDIIDNHVTLAKANVEKGQTELESASYYQSQARKKKCCIIVIVCAVILFVALMAGLLSSKGSGK